VIFSSHQRRYTFQLAKLTQLYICWSVTIKISVVVRKERIVVRSSEKLNMAGVIKSYKTFLLFGFTNIFNGVSSPNLSFLHDSSRRNNTVWSNNSSFLKNSSFKNNRVMANINSLLNSTRIKSAIILNNIISLKNEFCP